MLQKLDLKELAKAGANITLDATVYKIKLDLVDIIKANPKISVVISA